MPSKETPLNELASSPGIGRSRAIGWLGTTSRALVGVALLALGIMPGGDWIAWWQLGLGLAGLPAVLAVAQLARLSFTKRQLSQTDHLATCLNCAVVISLLVASATRNATLVFLGASMLLAALRGYGGCESLAITNWLLRRNDQVGCLFFSPVDQLEARRVTRSA
jgi:hypothetical protein